MKSQSIPTFQMDEPGDVEFTKVKETTNKSDSSYEELTKLWDRVEDSKKKYEVRIPPKTRARNLFAGFPEAGKSAMLNNIKFLQVLLEHKYLYDAIRELDFSNFTKEQFYPLTTFEVCACGNTQVTQPGEWNDYHASDKVTWTDVAGLDNPDHLKEGENADPEKIDFYNMIMRIKKVHTERMKNPVVENKVSEDSCRVDSITCVFQLPEMDEPKSKVLELLKKFKDLMDYVRGKVFVTLPLFTGLDKIDFSAKIPEESWYFGMKDLGDVSQSLSYTLNVNDFTFISSPRYEKYAGLVTALKSKNISEDKMKELASQLPSPQTLYSTMEFLGVVYERLAKKMEHSVYREQLRLWQPAYWKLELKYMRSVVEKKYDSVMRKKTVSKEMGSLLKMATLMIILLVAIKFLWW